MGSRTKLHLAGEASALYPWSCWSTGSHEANRGRDMRGQGLAWLRALGALILTAMLVVGVPFLLITLVGNPFPADLPTVNEIRILLTQNGQGFTNFLLSALAVLIWVIWAQLIVALVAEVIATARRTETRRLRIVPGLQGFAARLVAAMTLATILATGPLIAPTVGALSFNDVASSPAPIERVIDLRDHVLADNAATVAAPRDAPTAPAAPAEAAIMVVDEHTELWDLADAAYGDGVSWKLIAGANEGTVDASGLAITAETESVAPGTELVLPGVVRADQISRFGSLAARGTGDLSGQQRVQPGDSMWTIAQDQVAERLGRPGTEAEVATYWADVVEANQQVTSGNVDMIYPDEMLDLPGDQVANDARTAPDSSRRAEFSGEQLASSTVEQVREAPYEVPADSSVADGPVDLRTTTQPANLESADLEPTEPTEPTGPSEAAGPIETPAAAVAPVPVEPEVAIAGPTDTAAEPSPVLPASGQADTSTDGPSTVPAFGLVGLGTAILSAGVASAVRRRRDAQRRTRPAGTRAPASSSEAAAFEAAILHASHELKESTQGLGWRALPASAVEALRPGTPPEIHASATGELVAVGVSTVDSANPAEAHSELALPMAASIVVGTDIATGDAVLLDLIPATAVRVEGTDESIRRFMRSALIDLAVSERADDICVIAVGVGEEVDDLERAQVVADYSEALAHIVRSGLGAQDFATVEFATPVVVLATAPPDPADDSFDKLLAAGAAVMAPSIESHTRLVLSSDRATIEPSGTCAALAAFDDDDYRAVAELVETTSPTAIELVDPTVKMHNVLDVAAAEECPIEPGSIELRILGPVEVQGAAPFSSLKAVDVIAYLAFHRHGVDADQIKTWVWPPFDPPTDKAFANVMSRARTGLGAGEDGEPYLSRAGADKTYRLSTSVTTDFDRVRALGELAEKSNDDAMTVTLLKQALELIRGVPFTGGAASSFAWADNHVRAQVEYTIDELVHQCADLALELGDLATARWAALKGLALVPGCEQCFRRRFLVAGAGNNRSELRRAMADLEAAAMVDLGEPEAVDSISGELLDLYNELDSALVAGNA